MTTPFHIQNAENTSPLSDRQVGVLGEKWCNRWKTAICLLAKSPSEIWLGFLESFREYDIFVVIDDNTENYSEKYAGLYTNIKFIQIDNAICFAAGYTNCNTAVGFPEVIAWDKAMYLFCERELEYENVWFIEDDAFLNDEKTLLKIDGNSANINADLLTAFHEINATGDVWSGWNHWVNVVHRIDPPWAHSMVCACRIGRRLLDEIVAYKKIHGHLFFIEAMFNTIAQQCGLSIQNPIELSTIHWNTNWGIDEIDCNKLYHPMKCIADHHYIRESSQSAGRCFVPPS